MYVTMYILTLAPAPAFGFSSTTPAPAPGTSLFGSTPTAAAAPGTSLFSSTAPTAAVPGFQAAAVPPPAGLNGSVPYHQLPPDQKRIIDTLHEAMMQHKRTMAQVSTMAPKLLMTSSTSKSASGSSASGARIGQADMAAGAGADSSTLSSLPQKTAHLKSQLKSLQQQFQTLQEQVDHTKLNSETATTQAYMYARWPTEAVASRRGVNLTKSSSKSATSTSASTSTTSSSNNNNDDKSVQQKIQQLLDRTMTHVDRIEQMPSPYLWQVLRDMEARLELLYTHIESLHKQLLSSSSQPGGNAPINVTQIVTAQNDAIWNLASQWSSLHHRVDQLRHQYRMYEASTGGAVVNVLDAAHQQDMAHQQALDHQLKLQMVRAMPAAPASAPPAAAGGSSLFGSSTPAPSTGFGTTGGSLFGSTPAPAGGSLFGSTPAAAPAGGSLFGSTPTPAPAGGSLFGSTPAAAPAGGSLFGTSPAPAPAFGAAPAPPAAGGGSLFGATPTPAPAFGAAPAGGAFGSFGASTTTTTTPKKNKSRSTRRR